MQGRAHRKFLSKDKIEPLTRAIQSTTLGKHPSPFCEWMSRFECRIAGLADPVLQCVYIHSILISFPVEH